MSDIQNSAATEPATAQVTQNTDGAEVETPGGPRLDPQNDAVKDADD